MTAEFDPTNMPDDQLELAIEYRQRMIRGEVIPMYARPIDQLREEIGLMVVEFTKRHEESDDDPQDH